MVSEIKSFEERKQNLIKKGKELGFITYEELAEEQKARAEFSLRAPCYLYDYFSMYTVLPVLEDS